MNKKLEPPFGIKIITALKVISGVIYISYALLYVADRSAFNQLDFFGASQDYDLAVFLINAPGILVAFGLWRLRRWAWVLVMLQTGIQMAVDFSVYIDGERPYLQMLLNVIVIFYLNQRDVQRIFFDDPETQENTL